ncbi:MAG TPA: TonB family protein [Pyrinomonadaceae bacterium]|jgi:protein TonB|nr:TonB family protein [Pyrinomonadaceae bacterium]
MRSFRFASHHSSSRLITFFSLLVLLICVPLVSAQSPAVSAAPAANQATAAAPDWETLRPEGEEFSVLMPKGSVFESSKEPYHKMELNTRTYISQSPSGPVFAVVSLSGIKSNPAQYTEMQRINSYVDAFKDILTPKIRKGAIAKLTLVGAKTLQGNAGREYRMVLGDLTGTAQVFATRKRFYAIVHLSTKKEDELQEQFLSSFVLPEKMESITAAAQSPAAATVEAEPAPKPAETPTDQANANADKKTSEAEHSAAQPGKRGPISAGVLNGKALSLPKPEYPAEAKAAGADGVVVVQVTIDEQGSVTEARAISGPPLLQQVSVNAALQAKFLPTLLAGEPVKVTGVLVFNFGHPMG